MLRFFRLYMKYILAVFVALLMVAFLIQPTLSMFGPDPTGEVIGSIGSQELTIGDQRQANTQLRIVGQLSPTLLFLAGNAPGQPPTALQWLLMLQDARALGLSVSDAQVDAVLESIGKDPLELSNVARNMGVSISTLKAAVADCLIVQSYKELVSGFVHTPIDQRIGHFATAGQFLQYRYYQGAMIEMESAFRGSPRMSRPLVERFLYDYRATAQIAAAVLAATPDDLSPQPSSESMNDLFERYKSVERGRGEPYGLGYRIPDRVRIEFLTIPFDRVVQQARVEEAEALSYYDDHKDEFKTAASQPPPSDPADQALSYEAARSQIIERLRRQQATEVAQRMVKSAQAFLLEDTRQLAESGGYRVVPDSWRPVSLDRVADKLHEQFGIRPRVHHHQARWFTASQLGQLPGIGTSTLTVNQQPVGFVQYVLSTRELLAENADHPLSTLRLQVHVPSLPLSTPDGGRYLFRLTHAQPNRVPDSIDEVRQQVDQDARRLAAYEQLRSQAATRLAEVKEEGLDGWAKRQGLTVLNPRPFPKRLPGQSGLLPVPNVEGIGASEVLVDTVFDTADRLLQPSPSDPQQPTGSAFGRFDQIPEAQRTSLVAVDRLMSLVAIRVDGLEPISESNYKSIAQSPQLGAWINQTLTDAQSVDPLSIASLSKRVGFESAYPDEPTEPNE